MYNNVGIRFVRCTMTNILVVHTAMENRENRDDFLN